MSVENLRKYAQKCTEDEHIRAKAKEIGLQDMDGQIAHGKSLGLEFSREDFLALAKEAGIEGKIELAEEDLKKVAGGIFTTTAAILTGFVVVGSAAGLAAANQPGW
jgi:predicted ribosomally synthesized peptide with nif11-like leader